MILTGAVFMRPFLFGDIFMYILKAEASFDSAHFLHGYCGKCSNIHGHRWKITAQIKGGELCTDEQHRGMLVDFGDLKHDLRQIADSLDHALIYEENTLRQSTEKALAEEGFKTIVLPFRPTAENLSAYIYRLMTEKGYDVYKVTVYETPDNCAEYMEEL